MIHFKGEFDEQGNPLAFINGIPARDLTTDEWAALSEAQRTHAAASGLYDVPAATPQPEQELPAPQPGATFNETQEGN